MAKKKFLDEAGVEHLVGKVKALHATGDAQARKDVAELQDAVWPLEVSLSVSPGVVKVGSTTQVAVSWGATCKGADVVAQSTVKLNGAVVTGKSKSVELANATVGNHAYGLEVVYGSRSKSVTRNVTAVYPSYHGVVADGWAASAAGVKALTEALQTGRGTTRTGINLSNQKSVYAYPKSYGALSSVKDGNNFEVLGSYTRSELTIDGWEYYVYVLTNPVTASGVKQVFA